MLLAILQVAQCYLVHHQVMRSQLLFYFLIVCSSVISTVWVIPRAFFSMHCCLPGCFSIAKWLNQDFLAQSLHNKSNIHITKPGLSINCIINRPPSVLGIGYSRSISLSFKLWWFYRFSRKSHLLDHTYCLWTYLAWTESRWNAIRQFQQDLTDRYIWQGRTTTALLYFKLFCSYSEGVYLSVTK